MYHNCPSKAFRLYNKIPTNYRPTTSSVCLLYINAFEGQLWYILKDKNPTSLEKSKEFSIDIEQNLLDSKLEPFQYNRNKTKSRTKVSNNNDHDPIALLTQKTDQLNTHFDQVRNHLMNCMTTVEINQSSPIPQFTIQQRYATSWKPRPQ